MFTARRLLIALPALAMFAATAAAQTSQTTTQSGAATVTTEQMSGEVMKVEGNNLVVRMTNGELRTFSNIPDTRTALIDGAEVGARNLKAGTRLTATITKTATPVTVRTVTVGTGKVWFVMAPNVILTLPNGENKQYTVKPDYKFIVNGREATVTDLRPGMVVSAEKIVEEPKVDFATNTRVTGTAPVAAAAAAAPRAPASAAPIANSASAAQSTGSPSASASAASLPKTGSQLPLVGLFGLLLLAGSYGTRVLRRSL